MHLWPGTVDFIEKENKDLILESVFFDVISRINTNYFREIIYNLEHCIHHQALIRVAIEECTDLQLPESFGVAPSTLLYRERVLQ